MMFFAVFCSVVFLLFAGFVVRAWRAGSGAPLKEAGWGVLAGVAAGVVWGVGARLAMRLVAVADGRPTEFSVGGTLVIVITGMMFGLPLGLLFATVRGHLPGWASVGAYRSASSWRCSSWSPLSRSARATSAETHSTPPSCSAPPCSVPCSACTEPSWRP